MSVYDRILDAKLKAAPLLAVNCTDARATINSISEVLRASKSFKTSLLAEWDYARGLYPSDDDSRQPLGNVFSKCGEGVGGDSFLEPSVMLKFIAQMMPEGAVVFMHNAHKYMGEAVNIQAIWNLRDTFETSGRTLVMLSSCFKVPAELTNDILVFDEPLPTPDEIRAIVEKLVKQTKEEALPSLPVPTDEQYDEATKALTGLNAFAAKQVAALAIKKTGLCLPDLWSRKKQMVEATGGLSVIDNPKDTFDAIGGLNNLKTYMSRVNRGRNKPNCVVFVDELEKMVGSSHDTSGVSQGFLGTLLTFMQETESVGILLVSPPGCGKSATAKAMGHDGAIPTIMLDLNGMKGSLVGESEQKLRQALKTISAVSQGRTFFIATCNSLASLPPELKRRFVDGTFFVDLPNEEERAAIWAIHIKRYGLDPNQPLPNSEGWSGANIHDCCSRAYRLDCTLVESRAYVVPLYRSDKASVDTLREQANGRFLSASYEGTYSLYAEDPAAPATTPARRKVQMEE